MEFLTSVEFEEATHGVLARYGLQTFQMISRNWISMNLDRVSWPSRMLFGFSESFSFFFFLFNNQASRLGYAHLN